MAIYAYAAGKNYTYTASDCKKAGLEFDKPGIGTRAGYRDVSFIQQAELSSEIRI